MSRALFLFSLVCLLALLAARPSFGQQKPSTKGGNPPPSLKVLYTALNDSNTTTTDLESIVFRTFGKQNLSMGKVGSRSDGTLVAWALMNKETAKVMDAADKEIGQFKAIGHSGLQVLCREVPNFSNISFRVHTGGSTLQAGEFHIENYTMPPEYLPSPEVPEGREEVFEFNASKIFPKTVRQVTIYIPVQYDPAKESALIVWQDGTRHADRKGQIRATVVMDHLIAKGEMPVTIGVFIDPGRRESQKTSDKAANRGFEYDSLGDAYVRFITEEVLPEVQHRYSVKCSDQPQMRAIAGGSSGGICAFTAAWERPDLFGRVLCWVGSFVDLRGGHVYPALVRKTERKPIRVYLFGGKNDLDNSYGNWPLANLNMAAALRFQRYDCRFDYGECFHGSKGMSASLPEALRWLWRK
jgi:enterochelin esterase family protein